MGLQIPIERLARMIRDEPPDATLGALARKYDVPERRIIDAMDVLKIRNGEPTTIPPVEW